MIDRCTFSTFYDTLSRLRAFCFLFGLTSELASEAGVSSVSNPTNGSSADETDLISVISFLTTIFTSVRLQVDVTKQEVLHDDDDLREEPEHSYVEVPSGLTEVKSHGSEMDRIAGLLA